jgi:NAD(P)-dependent dehydrogenase (short-subunit alcohol dehydrogenase family)
LKITLDPSSEQWLANFETNVFGAVKVTKAMLAHFRSRKSGTLVFTGSMASYGGGAGVSTYTATKGSVSLIAESVAAETAAIGIKTVCFEPGYFRTNLLSGNNLSLAPDVSIPDYGTAAKEIKDMFSSTGGNQAGDVDKGITKMLDIIDAIRAGQKFPVRVPIGADIVEYCKFRSQRLIDDLQVHGKMLADTNIDGVPVPPLEMLGMYLP